MGVLQTIKDKTELEYMNVILLLFYHLLLLLILNYKLQLYHNV